MALRDAVWERLDRWDQLATRAAPEILLPIARNELHRLVEGLRTLLEEHDPDGEDHCPACIGPLGRKPWPCDVWLTAHRQLIGGHTEHSAHATGGPLEDQVGDHAVSDDHSVPGGAAAGNANSEHSPSADVAPADASDAPVWPSERADPDLTSFGTEHLGRGEPANPSWIVTSWDTVSTAEIPAVSQHTPWQTDYAAMHSARASERPPWRQGPL